MRGLRAKRDGHAEALLVELPAERGFVALGNAAGLYFAQRGTVLSPDGERVAVLEHEAVPAPADAGPLARSSS